MNPVLDIYKASAGSGKTFLLTIKYLQLLFRRPDSYRNILAVTFTNKATAEMKGRILDVLKWLVTDHERAIPYRAKLLEDLPEFDIDSLRVTADRVYRSILHDYSRFSVSTIDSFVQKIVRSFAWEVGIDGGFQLQMDTTPVKDDLAERMYKRLDTDADLRRWVVDMAKERLAEGKGWSVRDDMTQLAEELFKERFAFFEEGLRSVGDDAEIVVAFSEMMRKLGWFTRDFEDTWKARAQPVVDWIAQNGLDVSDFNYGGGGFIGFFIKAANGDTKKPGSRYNDAVENGGKLASGKASPAAKSVIEGWRSQLENIGGDMLSYRAERFPMYVAAVAIRKNLGVLRIMRVFYEELKNYRTENNKLLMSDTHLLLRQLTRDTSASFIYEKTGSRYQHFLIDEFQDTSGFQWDNFKPLIENAMGEGAYNLIVGDVKQAIYRWRNGDWRLLLSEVQRQLGNAMVEEHTLRDNRRSARQVIEFNNYLFFAAPRILQQQMDGEMQKAPPNVFDRLLANGYNNIFTNAYADAIQQTPGGVAENGLVQYRFIPAKDENGEAIDYYAVVLAELYDAIIKLLEEGFLASDLAILVRTNKEAATIVQYLLEAQQLPGSRKFDILSGDALLLARFPAVQLLICALRVIADARDKTSYAHLKYLAQLQSGSPSITHEVFASNGGDMGLPPAFVQNKHRFKTLPLSEMVHQLIEVFALHHRPENAPYLVAFQDLVIQWSKSGEQGVQAFLKYWDEEGSGKSLPGGANAQAVEVITIHKAKGLAYTVVLMPFLSWDLVNAGLKAPTLWVDSSQSLFNDIPVVPVRYKKDLSESVFAYEYFEEQVLSVMDNLNVLYVACTRARQRIYGWVPDEKVTDTGINTMGKLLKEVASGTQSWQTNGLTNTRSGFDKDSLTWEYGETLPPIANDSINQSTWMPALAYHRWQKGLQVRYKPLSTEEESASRLPREQGVLMHDALSRLQQPGDADAVLKQLLAQGLITETVSAKIKKQLEGILALPVFDNWNSGTMQRLAERTLLTDKRELRRPDWVLYNASETVVIDFKFTEDNQAVARHVMQVQEYMALLSKAGFAGLKGYVVYGNTLDVVVVNPASL